MQFTQNNSCFKNISTFRPTEICTPAANLRMKIDKYSHNALFKTQQTLEN